MWNLVLACKACNNEKLARVPSLRHLDRLYVRNKFYIGSHHPLRETIMLQTGTLHEDRHDYLQRAYYAAKEHLIHNWEPESVEEGRF
jgi:hypothetical protein